MPPKSSKIVDYKRDAVISAIAIMWAVCHVCVVANSGELDKQCFSATGASLLPGVIGRARDRAERKDVEAVAR
jgi:hypothetical protein